MVVIEQPRLTPRLRLKPKAPTTGYVDGAWWPRSRDLSTELPALLAVLAVRLGRIQKVNYQLADWAAASRSLSFRGHRVRLAGFNAQRPHTVDVVGLNGSRLTVLVVPSATSDAIAHRTLMTAAEPGNIDGVEVLMAAIGDQAGPAVQRWEADGGRVPQPA